MGHVDFVQARNAAISVMPRGMGMKGAFLLGLAAAGLAACAPVANSPEIASAPAPINEPKADAEPASGLTPRAARIAQALVRAESAYVAGETQRLGELIAGLNASGLTMHAAAPKDVIAMWSKAVGEGAPPFRGRLLGPAYVRGELAPGEIWKSAQTFKSGEASTLSVSHNGIGPVRMKVSDRKARTVCGISKADRPACQFTPRFTQRYDIELVNEGRERAVYFLVFD